MKYRYEDYKGWKPDEIIAGDHWILGSGRSISSPPLNPSGDWTKWLPSIESQRQVWGDPMNCTVEGTLKCIETLLNFHGLPVQNFSGRWGGWNAGITREGGSAHRSAETLRKAGVPLEHKWPAKGTMSFEQFYENPPTGLFQDARDDFLNKYTFNHEWIANPSVEAIRYALQYSPVGISVTAWFKQADGTYTDMGMPNNHWVECHGYDEEKQAFKVWDSDDEAYKLYRGHIQQAKRFKLDLTPTPAGHTLPKWLATLLRVLGILKTVNIPVDEKRVNDIVKIATESDAPAPQPVETPQERLLRASYEALGHDITPRDNVPDVVACAESLSSLLRDTFGDFKILPYTPNLATALDADQRFERVTEFEPGNIIISPTIEGNMYPGHCGVIAEKDMIHSNESQDGKWKANFTVAGWIKRYKTVGKMRVLVFKPISSK